MCDIKTFVNEIEDTDCINHDLETISCLKLCLTNL